jgi:hypothetical protein
MKRSLTLCAIVITFALTPILPQLSYNVKGQFSEFEKLLLILFYHYHNSRLYQS